MRAVTLGGIHRFPCVDQRVRSCGHRSQPRSKPHQLLRQLLAEQRHRARQAFRQRDTDVALLEEELRQVAAVLAGDASSLVPARF
jgi:hypothetical protein